MKTAVEWLVEQMTQLDFIAIPKPEWIQQAKAMEKQQMIEAVDFSLSSIELSEDKNSWTALTAEQYYNERFILKTI